MSQENLESLKLRVEAILFSYGDWVLISEIQNVLGLDSELLLNNALFELEKKYAKKDFSFKVEFNGDNKWRMALKDEYEELITELVSNVDIPKPVLKVLSVIAYEQPVTKTRLSEILGKAVKKEVDYLYENKFLSYEKNGIGKYYRVTKKFNDYFKIDEMDDFRKKANKSIKTFIEENKDVAKKVEEGADISSGEVNQSS